MKMVFQTLVFYYKNVQKRNFAFLNKTSISASNRRRKMPLKQTTATAGVTAVVPSLIGNGSLQVFVPTNNPPTQAYGQDANPSQIAKPQRIIPANAAVPGQLAQSYAVQAADVDLTTGQVSAGITNLGLTTITATLLSDGSTVFNGTFGEEPVVSGVAAAGANTATLTGTFTLTLPSGPVTLSAPFNVTTDGTPFNQQQFDTGFDVFVTSAGAATITGEGSGLSIEATSVLLGATGYTHFTDEGVAATFLPGGTGSTAVTKAWAGFNLATKASQ